MPSNIVRSTLWQFLLSYRFVGPLAVAFAVLFVATNEFGARADVDVNAKRDLTVRMRLTVLDSRRTVLLMESALRGYFLTGRLEYREPYDSARARTSSDVQALRELAQQVPEHRAEIGRLVDVLEFKMSELSEVMRLFDAGERDRALNLILTDIGREQMERIHEIVDGVIRGEEQEYARSAVQRDRVQVWRRIALYSLVLLSLGTVFAARRMAREHESERASHLLALNAERDKLEGEVMRRTHELTDLARHLQTVREDERSHLARELHDELGGLLMVAKLDIARVRRQTAGAAPETTESIDHLAQTLDAGIGLKRRIIEDLRPSALTNLGLQKTLEILCEEFAQRADIQVKASIAELELSDARELAIFRIVQEALTNVAKYAKAKTVYVTLERVADQARVEVRDDGVGFDLQRLQLGAHGLAGMRFRTQSFGGAWQIESAPGKGTSLRASIPMQGLNDNATLTGEPVST